MTVLAPASFTNLPSLMSLSSPKSSSKLSERVNDRQVTAWQSPSSASMNKVQVSDGHKRSVSFHGPSSVSASEVQVSAHKRSVSFNEGVIAVPPDVHPSSDLGCTHLWLQSRVPLG